MSGAEMFNLILIAALMAAIVAYALIKSHLADSKKVTDGAGRHVMEVYATDRTFKSAEHSKLKPLRKTRALIVKPVKREPHT